MNFDMSVLPKGTQVCTYGTPVENPKKHVVLYHGPTCADGFAAAFAIHHALNKKTDSVDALYVPMSYASRFNTLEALLPYLKDADVSVVDFSFPVESVKVMIEAGAASVTLLDHHSGAAGDIAAINQALEDGEFKHLHVIAVFDNDYSGAMLTWNHYHGYREAAPEVFKYIQDRDLWTWTYGDRTKFTMAAIFSLPFKFPVWDEFVQRDVLSRLYIEGRAITRTRDKDIDAHAERQNVTFREFKGVIVAFVNAPWYVASELGNKLLELYPHIDAADVWFHTDTTAKHSFRARKAGTNVAELLKPFGGGGHAAAAGVEFDYGDENMAAFLEELNR